MYEMVCNASFGPARQVSFCWCLKSLLLSVVRIDQDLFACLPSRSVLLRDCYRFPVLLLRH